MPETALPVTEEELHHWKLLDRFRDKLLTHLSAGAGPPTQLTGASLLQSVLVPAAEPGHHQHARVVRFHQHKTETAWLNWVVPLQGQMKSL